LKNLTVPVVVDILKLPEINHIICCHSLNVYGQRFTEIQNSRNQKQDGHY